MKHPDLPTSGSRFGFAFGKGFGNWPSPCRGGSRTGRADLPPGENAGILHFALEGVYAFSRSPAPGNGRGAFELHSYDGIEPTFQVGSILNGSAFLPISLAKSHSICSRGYIHPCGVMKVNYISAILVNIYVVLYYIHIMTSN